MSVSLGVTTVSTAAYKNVKAGVTQEMPLPVAAGVAGKVGQVLKYDASTHTWGAFSAFNAGDILAVFADTDLHTDAGTALAAAATANCIVGGHVNLYGLDATAQADADIVAALRENGIYALASVAE